MKLIAMNVALSNNKNSNEQIPNKPPKSISNGTSSMKADIALSMDEIIAGGIGRTLRTKYSLNALRHKMTSRISSTIAMEEATEFSRM